MIPNHSDLPGSPWPILPPGIHSATLAEVETRFASNPKRRVQFRGFVAALANLQGAGCRRAFLDGSFITAKPRPGDYDACWDPTGVDPTFLDPVLLNFENNRAAQKAKYHGELFPSTTPADQAGTIFVEFFQVDRFTSTPKGIVAIDLPDAPTHGDIMIYSDKQYAISEGQLGKFRDALAAAQSENAAATGEHNWLRDTQSDAIRSQIATLEAELSHYELLKSGDITFSKTHSLENLPSVLVQARIAAGLSQTDLAERLGMKAQQIQRYEASDYSGASLDRLIDVCEALNVHISGLFESDDNSKGSVFSWSDINDVVWKEFPAREMAKRGWFDVPRKGDIYQLARDYFMRAAGPQFASAYHRKKMHGGSVPNEYALLAWQARILERARDIVETHDPPEFVADDRWIADLIALTRRKDGPKRVQALLLSKGIILIIEKHLPGTYLDGGAMLDRDGRPIIGLTLRFDRLDNFWFVLLHELGHVFLHLMDGLRYDFFDEEETVGDDKVEREADAFALDSLMPEAKWDECLSRFALSEEAVRIDAKNLGIDPSIIAGRIRKERGDYTILGGLIGQDQVASQFEDDRDELV